MRDDPRKMDLNSRLAANPDLVLRIEDDDCALLFDPDSGSVRILNETAVEIWQRLDGQRTLAAILRELGDIYDGIGPEAADRVLAMLDDLAAVGAVEVRESP